MTISSTKDAIWIWLWFFLKSIWNQSLRNVFLRWVPNFLPGWELPAGYHRALGSLSFKLVFSNGHSYIEKPCNYGVYTLIIFSTTCFVATWRYILASLEMLQTLCIAWYLRLAMLANTDYESCWSTSCMAKVYSWKIGPNCRWKRKINIILPVIYNIILLYLIISY